VRIDPVIDCPVHFYKRHVATTPRTKVNPKTERPRLHKVILINAAVPASDSHLVPLTSLKD